MNAPADLRAPYPHLVAPDRRDGWPVQNASGPLAPSRRTTVECPCAMCTARRAAQTSS